jgi:hypothetical protein
MLLPHLSSCHLQMLLKDLQELVALLQPLVVRKLVSAPARPLLWRC